MSNNIKRKMKRGQAKTPKKTQEEKMMEGRQLEARGSNLMKQIDPESGQEMPEEMRRQVETINGALTDMVYDPKTKASVQKMLQSGDITVDVPKAVNTIYQRFEDLMTPKNGPMPLSLRLSSGVHLHQEIMTLGQTMGLIPEQISEADATALMQASIQQYIQKGLKDKSIDPIELQQEIDPLLTEEERNLGNMAGQKLGVPSELTQTQANRGMMDRQMQPLQVENSQLRKQNTQMTGALQGMADAPTQQPQEGDM